MRRAWRPRAPPTSKRALPDTLTDGLLPRAMHPALPSYVILAVTKYPESPVGPFTLAVLRLGSRAGAHGREENSGQHGVSHPIPEHGSQRPFRQARSRTGRGCLFADPEERRPGRRRGQFGWQLDPLQPEIGGEGREHGPRG